MASLSSNPSSVVSAGTWTGGANVYLSDNVFATNTGATQNTEYPLEVGGFNFSAIPAGSTVDSVTVTIEAKTGTANRAQIKGELLDGSTVLGTRALTNLTAADANYTFTPTATLAQLQSANLKVRVTNKRIVSQASTTSVDWVKVDVVYTPIPPAVTQAAYRFYADGTETGATALAGQDTAPTVDVASGDVSLGLRVRLQETNGGAVPASTDWQLQWEKNASGTWVDAGKGLVSLVDSWTVQDSGTFLGAGDTQNAAGQSFRGNGGKLTVAEFRLSKVGAPPGNVQVHLYAHTGTFGIAEGLATGPPLASSTPRAASTLATTHQWETFTFDGTYTLTNTTPYVIAVEYITGDGSNDITYRFDGSTAAAAGIKQSRGTGTGIWNANISQDLAFRVYTTGAASTVALYDSPSLTDAATTTSRLTGGSGSFVAGKVSEDGLADDVGWAASNHTELLYSVTLKQADLTAGDTLRFRVLKNGATTDLTYTAVPTVTIGAGGPPPVTATVALTASSTLTATASVVTPPVVSATVALSAVSTLSATGTVVAPTVVAAAAALTASSTLTATGTVAAPTVVSAAVALTATSTLSATAVRQPQATASLVAASTLTVTATRFGVLLATVPLTAAGTLTAAAVRVPQASVSLTATFTLTATGIRTQHATSALEAASQLTTGAVVARVPVVALSAVSTLTATAVRTPQATVSLTAVSTLTAAATITPAVFGTVAMSAAATLTATAVREPQAAASLVAVSTLTATATQTTYVTAPLDAVSTLTVLATAGPRPAGYLDECLADGPTVLWLCDEAPGATTAVDSSGSGKTGTAGAAVTFGAVGSGLISGYPTAATFAGTTTTANLLQAALTPLADGAAYSLELWIKTSLAAGVSRVAVGDIGTTAGTARGAVYAPSASALGVFQVSNTSSATFIASSVATVNDGAVHHLVATFGSGAARMYLDGALVGGPTTVTGTARALQSLRTGGTSSGANAFSGVAAGAAFYPTALSAARVAAHYAAGTAVPVVPVPATAALVASSTLTATATTTPAKFATAALTATSTLTATAVRQPQAAVSLTASSTLTATVVRQPQATVALTATAVLTVTGVRARVVAVALTASSSLTATPTRVRPATVPLSATSTLTVQLVRIPQAFVGMTATSVLVATATVTAAAVGIPNAAHTGFLHALDADLSWYPVTVPS